MDTTRFLNIFEKLSIICFLEFIKNGKEFYGLVNEGFQLHSSKRFYYFVENDAKNYYDAYGICENNRATLPVPISAEENEDIAQLLPGKNIWLDITAYSNEFWWGNYWSTSAPSDIVTYSNWRNGEGGPVECENEVNVLCEREKNFAFMSSSDGTNEWITAGELEKHYVVCIFRI